MCVPDTIKNINVKVFNLMSITNETRWTKDKFRYEYKELIDKGMCDKEFIWNSTNCECECDK